MFADYISVTKIHAEPVLLTYNENINLINTNHTKKKTYYLTFCLMMGSITQFGELVIQKKLIKLLIWQKKLKAFTLLMVITDSPLHQLESEINGCLAYIINKEQLEVFPFHRLVRSKYSYEEIINKLKDFGEIKIIEKPKSTNKNMQFYINKNWHELNNKKFNNIDLFMNIIKSAFGILEDRNNKDLFYSRT